MEKRFLHIFRELFIQKKLNSERSALRWLDNVHKINTTPTTTATATATATVCSVVSSGSRRKEKKSDTRRLGSCRAGIVWKFRSAAGVRFNAQKCGLWKNRGYRRETEAVHCKRAASFWCFNGGHGQGGFLHLRTKYFAYSCRCCGLQ